jgi:hypothetical protein
MAASTDDVDGVDGESREGALIESTTAMDTQDDERSSSAANDDVHDTGDTGDSHADKQDALGPCLPTASLAVDTRPAVQTLPAAVSHQSPPVPPLPKDLLLAESTSATDSSMQVAQSQQTTESSIPTGGDVTTTSASKEPALPLHAMPASVLPATTTPTIQVMESEERVEHQASIVQETQANKETETATSIQPPSENTDSSA